MNEKLQEALANTIIKATETAEQASEFILAEMPDVVQQILMWKMCESLISWLVIPLITSILIAIMTFTYKKLKKVNGEPTRTTVPLVFLSIIMAVIFLVNLCQLNLIWLQIWIVPKVYLIEYASSLIK